MQQKSYDCQQLAKTIRDAVRKEAKALEVSAAGAIKISIVPSVREADEMMGGYSEFDRGTERNPLPDDIATHDVTYDLDPNKGPDLNVASSYVNIHVKRKTLLSGNQTEGVTERVFVWKEFLDITVRVYGADNKGSALANAATPAVTAFFGERGIDFSTVMEP